MLKVKDLHAEINGKEILRGINLEVRPGEVHAIMGVMHNAQIFPRFFTTDKELGLAYLPLDEQIQALLENRTFFLQ